MRGEPEHLRDPSAESSIPLAPLPLSVRLAQAANGREIGQALTLNLVLGGLQESGALLVIVVLCFPFLLPVTIPGTSTPLGAVMFLLALRLAFTARATFPAWVGERRLPKGFDRVLGGGVRVLRFLERWLIRPRRTFWLRWPMVHSINALVLAFLAVLLALPIPPVIPLTNTLPAYGILLVALSMMEEDGALIWVGYVVTALTTVYFVVWAAAIEHLTARYWVSVWEWLQQFL